MNELTREKILAMPAGRELDKLVVQHVTHYQPLSTAICPDGTFDCHIPNYSTDISAAWEVQIKIDQLGLMFDYCQSIKIVVLSTGEYVGLIEYIRATSEQRCKAALLAVMDL